MGQSQRLICRIKEAVGELPIPPYLNRPTEESDKTTYQTVYSKIKGSVAAPTAGLHFTDKVLAEIPIRGIVRDEVTLHVGAGTFKPVKTEMIEGHEMHSEVHSGAPPHTLEHLLSHNCRGHCRGHDECTYSRDVFIIWDSLAFSS